ncbi:Acidic endochitinase SP2 [Zancudomyces culisetae]|uniref:Acidic endochitinase SP2 n=1 Tax=Zancudomyces culisetae TaxID=1213189 RepID=A0A1R1PP58_ZANCU|nr:Acidic endochitinase SP2 [Zancudomyces culisetae]|eukprot:OMH82765.1 Acidic endochitinase SP2 [Zancudomyces culisetae]
MYKGIVAGISALAFSSSIVGMPAPLGGDYNKFALSGKLGYQRRDRVEKFSNLQEDISENSNIENNIQNEGPGYEWAEEIPNQMQQMVYRRVAVAQRQPSYASPQNMQGNVYRRQQASCRPRPSTSIGSSSSTGASSAAQGAGGLNIDCNKFYNAVQAAGYPKPTEAQCKAFLAGLPTGKIASLREAAMFLTQILWESDGLRAKEEYYCKTNDCKAAYGSPLDVPGKIYYGRGYIQLTWAANYQAASKALYGDDRLLKNPETVGTDEKTAWDVSFWFWRDRVRTDPGVMAGKFGSSTNMINGALECRGAYQAKAKKRFENYKKILPVLDPSATPIESGCYN